MKYEVTEIPAELKESAKAALRELIDAVSNKDDAIAELVIEDKPIDAADFEGRHSPADLQDRIRSRAVRFRFQEERRAGSGRCGRRLSAQPAGRSRRRRPGARHRRQVVKVESDDNSKFCSLAFKLWTDPYAGKLVFFRVYSGQLKKGDTIYNPRTRKRERVSRLMVIQGSERKDVERSLRRRHRRAGRSAQHHHR